ncbi:hypothetical protein KY290_001097 [Solanum tuberosum]|uniref:Uncharacterized protein n=1 Tax=Solanum tuberosum TaxID=4113 RepID=A0ABQ7WN69_SOLTU|nr:hypothetical protein KY290_001097 [Solanum tuberosum]
MFLGDVVEFYTNLEVLEENVVTSTVKGAELVFDHIRLGEILHVPTFGLAEYVWLNDEQCLLKFKFSQRRVTSKARKVLKVFNAFVVPLGEGRALTRAYMFTQSTLDECGLLAEPEQVPIASPRVSGPVTRLLRYLQITREHCETLQAENASLSADLTASKEEVGRLKDQLVQ